MGPIKAVVEAKGDSAGWMRRNVKKKKIGFRVPLINQEHRWVAIFALESTMIHIHPCLPFVSEH